MFPLSYLEKPANYMTNFAMDFFIDVMQLTQKARDSRLILTIKPINMCVTLKKQKRNTVWAIMFNLGNGLSYTGITLITQNEFTQFDYWKYWVITNTGDCRFHTIKSNIS